MQESEMLLLSTLPKVLQVAGNRYYLTIDWADSTMHLRYKASFHEDKALFIYWVNHNNAEDLLRVTKQFVEKVLDAGAVVVV